MVDGLIQSIQYFIIIQSALFILFLSLNGRLAQLPNRFLAGLVLVLAGHMAINLLGPLVNLGLLNAVAVGMGYAYGPLIWLYGRCLAEKQVAISIGSLWHAVPAGLATLIALATSISIFLLAAGILISLGVYAVLTWRRLSRFHYILAQTRADFEPVELNWLSRLVAVQFGLLTLNVVSVALGAMGYAEASRAVELVLFAGLLAMVSLLIFHGMQYPELFEGVGQEDRDIAQPPARADHADLAELMEKIDAHMEVSAAYLRPGLTVKSLGRQLLVNPVTVSQAINAGRGRNFSDYVNSLRVKHACKMLGDPEQADQTVLDVMLASGFNTKSNFNRSFKQETGATPLAYRKAALSDAAEKSDR
ncbi:helix-turn-helix domain-containing protein [Maricaulis sp.]|uniref:helix-turn-helix domain-containing protein n=1 Tax=Maricaulis sp. TaxID=1486257 RepID=UPI00263135C5|nr:helix-turn-helix domain-containing protein [Maricaulis sp.]